MSFFVGFVFLEALLCVITAHNPETSALTQQTLSLLIFQPSPKTMARQALYLSGELRGLYLLWRSLSNRAEKAKDSVN